MKNSGEFAGCWPYLPGFGAEPAGVPCRASAISSNSELSPRSGRSVQPRAPPVTITLKDALELAQKNDPQFLAALGDAAGAAEDLRQARASRYPSLSGRSEYLGTQGNGKP